MLLAPHPTYEIAACVRYYYPVVDARRSTHHAYLYSFGGKRLQLDSKPSHGVSWTDPKTVAWVRETKAGDEIWTSQAPFKERKLILRGKEIAGPGDGTYEVDGKRVHVVGQRITKHVASNLHSDGKGDLHKEGNKYVVGFGGHLNPVQNPASSWLVNCGVEGRLSFSIDELLDPHNANRSNFELEEVGSTDKWSLFAGLWGLTAHEAMLVLLRVNNHSHKAWAVPANVAGVCLQSGSGRFAGQSERLLKDGLWTNQLVVGNLVTGKVRNLVDGLVFVYGVELRPLK